MGIATWILLVYIVANMCVLVRPSGKLPDFFYDDEPQGSGHKKHRHRAKPQMSTEEFKTMYKPYYGNTVDKQEKPANALPEPASPRPFYTFSRGDSSDLNMLQQQDMQDGDSPFPPPDGNPFNNDDEYDLDELPRRLTKTNKWQEFNDLLAVQRKKWDGKVMPDWHDDAHMWASYSRQLLVREKNEKKTKAASRTPHKPQKIDPSVGLSPYWADPNDNQSPRESPAVPWGQGPGPGAGIKNMKDLRGPDGAQEPFPWDQDGGPGPDEGPGGSPPPGLDQEGQFPGGGFNMGGGPPPGMGQGGGGGPGGQFPGGGFNMGGGPPPGMSQGGGGGPGGQFPGGGFNMGGGPPPDMDQGGGGGQEGQFPGGSFNMGDGPPPGMSQGGGGGPGGQFPGGGFNMGGGPPTDMGQSGGGGPGGPFPGGGFNMGGGPPPGLGQGGGGGPGGQFPGGGFNMGGGPPPDMGQSGGGGPGGQFPGGGFNMGGGPPPGLGQGGGQGPGGQFSGGGASIGGAPHSPGFNPGEGLGQNRVQGPDVGLGPDEGYGPVGPPGPAGGRSPAGLGLGMAHGPGRAPGPGEGPGPGKSRGPDGLPGPRGVRGLGGRPGISQDPSGGQGLDGGYGPVGPPGPAGGWVQAGGRGPGMGRGPSGPPGPDDGWGSRGGPPPGMGRGPGMFNGPGGPPGTGGSLGPGGGLRPGMGRGPGGPSGQSTHRRSLNQIKREGHNYMHRVTNFDFMIQPTRTPETMPSHADTRFLLPGTHAGDNVPEEGTNIDLLKSLSATPKPSHPSVSFDEHLSHNNAPTGTRGGKIPGPGSESEYPNGYRPSHGDLRQLGMAPSAGNFGMGQPHTREGGSSKAMALRQGQGANSGPGDYEDSIQNALRMGQGPPGLDVKQSFQPGMAEENMARGSQSGNMQRWPPGMGSAPPPPPGHKDRGTWLAEWGEHPPGMGRHHPPENKQRAQHPGMGGNVSPGYMQGGKPPGMRGDLPTGYMQGGQPPGMGRGSPSGYIPGAMEGMEEDLSPRYMQKGQPPLKGGHLPPGYMPTSFEGFRRSLDNSTVARGGYLQPPGPFSEKPTVRKGGGLASMNANVRPADYPEIVKTALRMNQMMAQSSDGEGGGGGGGLPPQYLRGGPPPGMGGGPPPGYMQGGPPPGMGGGPPSGYMQGGPPPGMGGGPPPGYMQGGRLPGMEGGPPPGYMQDGPPPGMGRGLSPEFQGRPKGPPAISGFPSGMPQGPPGPPGFTDSFGPSGDNPDLGYAAQGSPPPNNKMASGYQLMKIAQRKIEFQNRLDKIKAQPSGPTTEHLPTVEERLNTLRQFDDFQAPIRWVKLTAPDTKDGLARVTDKQTHRNQQFVIEGELYVPIVDESMARLGWTTESADETLVEISTRPNFAEYELKVVMRSMNLNYTTQQDWLAYETILGAKFKTENECTGESCQSRCHKAGCDCTCKGDSCASGCVGVSCNAICRGPACNAMCIGDQCTAKCEGLNCEAKCWGKDCSSSCSLLSCQYTINGGRSHTSNVTWDEVYPQYGRGQTFSNQNQQVKGPGAQRQRYDYGQGGDEYYD